MEFHINSSSLLELKELKLGGGIFMTLALDLYYLSKCYLHKLLPEICKYGFELGIALSSLF